MVLNPHFWVLVVSREGGIESVVTLPNGGGIRKFNSFNDAEQAGEDFIDNLGYDTYYVLGPTWTEENV